MSGASAPPPPAPGDRARASVQVKVAPEVAFDVFTREIDLWWRRGQKFRASGREVGALTFETALGGRLFERYRVGGEERLAVVGRVTAWEPPHRFVLDWRNVNFAPHERTEVEVRFVATANGGTMVTVEHRGWSALPPDHPAKHGLAPAPFVAMIGMWWGELLTALRLRLAGETAKGAR